jgi:hypothetical protein
MTALMKASMVGVLGVMMLVGTAAVSVALDDYLSQLHCKCTCIASNGNAKELGWGKTASCNSNGKACTFTLDGGKTFTPGKLSNCKDCSPGYPVAHCSPAKLSGAIQPGGTFQRR